MNTYGIDRLLSIKVILGITLLLSSASLTIYADQDGPIYSSEEDIPKEIIERQNTFSEIVSQITEKFPELYIGGESGEICKVYIKGPAPNAIKEIVGKASIKIKIVDNQKYSLFELGKKSEKVFRLLQKAGYRVEGGSFDIPDQITVMVVYKEGLPSTQKAILKLLPKDLAEMTSIDVVGGPGEKPGTVGYVIAVQPGSNEFLVTSYDAKAGKLACNDATWFTDDTMKLKPGQKVKVWSTFVMQSFPAQSSATRTEIVTDETRPTGEAAAVGLALKKLEEQKDFGYPFVTKVEYDKIRKQWTIMFASKVDAKIISRQITVTDQELSNIQK